MDGADFDAVGAGHRWECMEDLVDQRVGVDENNNIALFRGFVWLWNIEWRVVFGVRWGGGGFAK